MVKVIKKFIVTGMMLVFTTSSFVSAQPVPPTPPLPPGGEVVEQEETVVPEIPTETEQTIIPEESTQESSVETTQAPALEVPEDFVCGTNTDIENKETQNNIVNESNEPKSSNQTLNLENSAEVSNEIKESSNTGENEASYNTGNGTVETGNANSVLSLINLINSNFVALPGGDIVYLFKNIYTSLFGDYIIDPFTGETYSLSGARINVMNSNTGADSQNQASYEQNNQDQIEANNKTNTENNINLSANTGGNQASYNTRNGSVKTGDANVALNLFNMLNSNFIVSEKGLIGVINILGDFWGDLLLPQWLVNAFNNQVSVNNTNTGADSQNTANIEVENDTEIQNKNTAAISNNISGNSSTGNNQASYNTGGGTVTSGDTNALLNLKNIANTNIIGDVVVYLLVNVLGEWNGSSLLPVTFLLNGSDGVSFLVSNINTGAGSVNEASLSVNNDTQVKNDNEAILANNINLLANTGNNSSSYNTGSGSVSTGDANIAANIFNIINTNIIGKRVIFLAVNIFGNWFGDIDVNKPKSQETAGTTQSVTKSSPVLITVKKFVPKASFVMNAGGQNPDNSNLANKTETQAELTKSVSGVLSGNKGRVSEGKDTGDTKLYLVLLFVSYLGFLSVYLKRNNIKKRSKHERV